MLNDIEMLDRVRLTLNDLHGDFWTDRQLLDFIEDAKKEYCTKVPLLFKWVPVLQIEGDDKYYWDNSFIKYQYGETIAGDIIQPATNYSKFDKALVDNGDGTFRLIGVPEGELATIDDLSLIGVEVSLSGFDTWVFEFDKDNCTQKGIDDNSKLLLVGSPSELEFFGIENTFDTNYDDTPFGIANIRISGKPIAYLHCQRKSYEGFWEINDIPPIVFYTCYLALLAETDRKNVEIANVCLNFFTNIVNARSNRNLSSLKTINRGSFL